MERLQGKGEQKHRDNIWVYKRAFVKKSRDINMNGITTYRCYYIGTNKGMKVEWYKPNDFNECDIKMAL